MTDSHAGAGEATPPVEDDAANGCPGVGCSCYGNVALHNLPSASKDAYVKRENEVARIAQIIVDAGSKPYSAASAIVDAGYVLPPASGGTDG